MVQSLFAAQRRVMVLNQGGVRPVPPESPDGAWLTVMEAELHALYAEVPTIAPEQRDWQKNEASIALLKLLGEYRDGRVQEFNSQLAEYEKLIKDRASEEAIYEDDLARAGETGRKPAERLILPRLRFEQFFNHFSPFYWAMGLYVVAFVLSAVGWLAWPRVMNRSANWLLWFTFALHTFALVCRVYISGRPPVTNLYSVAVVIGWGAVFFALIYQRIYRFGLGNLLAAVVGFPTLFIAHNLAGDGDTFQVLQAVLDTQFWLATHVICITLGNSTTIFAGVIGLCYVLMGHLAGQFSESDQKNIVRMAYGTLCFATFFSFIGTVLGGLWADDSWGRFWGWDPKENGALLIVIWNAIVLHARWGGMVKHRGMAVLLIFGNVVAAWSLFGVNQMGVGLHAYGATEGRTRALCVFVVSQLVVMAVGVLPSRLWRRKAELPA
jgi:ABC-type transport system involved in cytochrome c biogenesis permease subunit